MIYQKDFLISNDKILKIILQYKNNHSHISLSNIQKELKKWQKGVDIALKDDEYIALSKEFGFDNEDISSKNITI